MRSSGSKIAFNSTEGPHDLRHRTSAPAARRGPGRRRARPTAIRRTTTTRSAARSRNERNGGYLPSGRGRTGCDSARSPGRSGRTAKPGEYPYSSNSDVQVAQVVAEPIGADGRVLPARPGQIVSGYVRRGAERGFAYFPELDVRASGSSKNSDGWSSRRVRPTVVEELVGSVDRPAAWVSPPICTMSHASPSGKRSSACGFRCFFALEPDEFLVERFQRDRTGLDDFGDGVGGGGDVGVSEQHQGVGLHARHELRARRAAR